MENSSSPVMENWTNIASNQTLISNEWTLTIGVFYILFTLIMFLPYLCCIGILVKEQKAASCKAFYTLAVHMGVVDISQLALNGFYCAFRCFLPRWTPPLAAENAIIVPLTACWFAYTMLAQFMALNRFYSVWYVTKVERIFSVENTRWMLASCYVYGAAHGIIRATPLVHLYYDPKVYAILYDQRPGSQMALEVNGVLNYIHSGALCFWYSLIYIRLLLNKRKIAAAGILRTQNDNRENKVLLQSVVICMSDLVACSLWIFLQEFLRGHWVLFVGNLVWLICAGNNPLIYVFLNRFIIFRKVPSKYVLENGEISLVTGSSCGIGCEIARQLGSRGSKVIWAARDVEKAQKELETGVCRSTQSTNSESYVQYIDLSSLKSIERFADDFKKKEGRLNILVLNAAYHGRYRQTEEGFEQTAGVNHLGHMYLCYQLLDMLKSSAPSRVIIVASEQHRMCSEKMTVDDLLFIKKEDYSRWTAYNRSKLLNMMFMKELSKRLDGSGITVHATHPGAPIDTSLMRDNVLGSRLIDYLILKPICFFFCRTVTEGAQTPLYPALVTEYGQKTGHYFENCCSTTMNPILDNEEVVRDVWNRSCDLLRIDRNWV